ncbi:hypothetical protein PInf_016994 [Phytophthora infestans]|nr:hypothetical protein PInf_016994 [Phytophthora infestans]
MGESSSSSTGLIIGLVIAAVVLLAVGGWYLRHCRRHKRVNGPRSHSQSTEYVDCVLTPDLMAIVADGSRRSSSSMGIGGKWFHHLPRITSVPPMEFFDHLSTGGGRDSISGATTTATGSSPVTNGTQLQWLDKCDSSDELACSAAALEQSRLPPNCVVDGELLHEGSFTLAFRATLRIEGQAESPGRRETPTSRTRRAAVVPSSVHGRYYAQCLTATSTDCSVHRVLRPNTARVRPRFTDITFTHCSTSSSALSSDEYMPNGDLRALLTLRPRSAQDFGWFHSVSVPKTKAHLALDIVDALVYLHSRPASVNTPLHPPQLKAQRVLLSELCDAKLCAFGVKRAQAPYTRSDFSVAWLAPELLRGEPRSEQADVYSLGVLFTELDTCELPFASGVDMDDGMDEQSQLALLVSSGCIRPSLSMDCPVQIQELVMRCLSFSPHQRPPIIEVQHTLRKLINGTSVCGTSQASLPSNVSSLRSTPGNATLNTLFTP